MAYLVGAISDDESVDGAPHGGILHHLPQHGLLPRRPGPLLRRRHAEGRLGAHRRVRHPKPPGRGRRERGRVWGGKAAGSAETETDLLLVRDAGGGHGVGETDSKAGAPAIYAVALWLRALAAAKAGEGNWEWVPVRLFLRSGQRRPRASSRSLVSSDRPPTSRPKKIRLNLSKLM